MADTVEGVRQKIAEIEEKANKLEENIERVELLLKDDPDPQQLTARLQHLAALQMHLAALQMQLAELLKKENRLAEGVAGAAGVADAAPLAGQAIYLKDFKDLTPSSVSKKLCDFIKQHQGAGNTSPLLMNLRPATAVSVVPVQLAAPMFQHVIAAVWEERCDNISSRDLQFVHNLTIAMSAGFEKEADRVVKFKEWLIDYLQLRDDQIINSRVADSQADLLVSMKLGSGDEVPLMFIEAKNELGVGGDAGVQGQLYYAQKVSSCQHLLRKTLCPALVLELVGPQVRVSGAVCLAGVVCEPLTPLLNLHALLGRQPQQVFCVARCFAAISKVLCELRTLYSTQRLTENVPDGLWGLHPTPMPEHLHRLVQSGAKVQQVQLGKMVYIVDLTGCTGSSLALSTDAPRLVVVKYVTERYGRKVHEAWADGGRAPRLLCMQHVVGPWHVVMMEFLRMEDGWFPLACILPRPHAPLHEVSMNATEGGSGAPNYRQLAEAVASVLGTTPALITLLRTRVCMALAEAQAITFASNSLTAASREVESSKPTLSRGAHGDMRPPNIMIKLPLGNINELDHDMLSSIFRSMAVKFVDFDWAGVDATATYPTLLNPDVKWPSGADYGAVITQGQDKELAHAAFPASSST